MTGGQKFCLRWDGFRSRLSSVFDELRQDGELLDVTLCCDGGHTVKAHRILLSASSPCLRQLLKDHPCQHPVFFLKDTSAEDLRAIIEFVYNGEVNVSQTQLASFIKTAELLQIRGLSGDGDPEGGQPVPSAGPQDRPTAAPSPPPPPRPPPPDTGPSGDGPAAGQPPAKRRRHSGGPSGASGPANTAAANANTNAKAASASSAAGTSAAEAGSAGNPQPIKTEQVDLCDDESAALEDTLACLSTFEAQSCSPQPVLDSSGGPQPREARRGDPSGDQSAGPSAGPSTSGAASQQGSGRGTKHHERHGNESLSRDDSSPSTSGTPPRRSGRWSSEHGLIREPKLDAGILPHSIRVKMTRQMHLEKNDWRVILECIHAEFKNTNVSTSGWYRKLAVSMAAEFPYLYRDVGLHQFIEILRVKIANKFRNGRRKPAPQIKGKGSRLRRKTRYYPPRTPPPVPETLEEPESEPQDQERPGQDQEPLEAVPPEDMHEEVLQDLELGGMLVQFVTESPDVREVGDLVIDEDARSDPLEICSSEKAGVKSPEDM